MQQRGLQLAAALDDLAEDSVLSVMCGISAFSGRSNIKPGCGSAFITALPTEW